jgi:tetratricopeptide (TPR) repeat protein
MFYLQVGRLDEAARHFRRYLELAPREFKALMAILTGRSGLRIRPVDETVIYSTIIPDDPKMLFDFAMRYMDESSPHKLKVLGKADLAVGDASLSNRDLVLLSGRIKLEMGDIAGGIERFEDALRSEPGDQQIRIQLARLYLNSGMLLQAKKLSDYLIRINRRDDEYIKLENDVKAAFDLQTEKERTKREDQP